MKTLKKTLALIAALTVVASLAGCKKDKEEPDKTTTTTKADTTTKAGGEQTTEPPVDNSASAPKPDDAAVKLKTGGDTFTVIAWNPNDFPALLNAYTGNWDGVTGASEDAVKVLEANKTTPTGKTIFFKDLGTGSQEAQQAYDNMLSGGEDIDVFAAEADFALNYTGDSTKSANLEDLGFKASDWKNAYSYTMEIAKNDKGEIRGVSWQACPGGYAYRADLAEQYLGVKTPEEMQPLVSSWSKMEETAAKVFEVSGGQTAIADTMGAIWQVFSSGRSTAWVVDDTLVTDDKSLLDYVDLVKRWADKGYVTKVSQWTDNWKPLGQNGKTLGFFVSTWGFGDSILLGAAGGEGGATYGQWKVVEGPAKFFWGGTWMIVNPKTDNGIEAKDFIWALTVDDDTMKQYAIKKGEYVNNKKVIPDVAKDATVADSTTTKNLGGQNFYNVLSGVASSITLDAKKITQYDAAIKSAFNDSVADYVNGVTADRGATIKAFEARVAKDVPSVLIPEE